MSKKQKIGKKIMKDIIKNLDDNRVLHIFGGLNSYQLWNKRNDVLDYIKNYFIDLDWCTDSPVYMNYDLCHLIQKVSKLG